MHLLFSLKAIGNDAAATSVLGVSSKRTHREATYPFSRKDATLRELVGCIQQVHEPARRANARLSFALVYPDMRGEMCERRVGTVHSMRGGADDSLSLEQLGFAIGDFVDVAVQY